MSGQGAPPAPARSACLQRSSRQPTSSACSRQERSGLSERQKSEKQEAAKQALVAELCSWHCILWLLQMKLRQGCKHALTQQQCSSRKDMHTHARTHTHLHTHIYTRTHARSSYSTQAERKASTHSSSSSSSSSSSDSNNSKQGFHFFRFVGGEGGHTQAQGCKILF